MEFRRLKPSLSSIPAVLPSRRPTSDSFLQRKTKSSCGEIQEEQDMQKLRKLIKNDDHQEATLIKKGRMFKGDMKKLLKLLRYDQIKWIVTQDAMSELESYTCLLRKRCFIECTKKTNGVSEPPPSSEQCPTSKSKLTKKKSQRNRTQKKNPCSQDNLIDNGTARKRKKIHKLPTKAPRRGLTPRWKEQVEKGVRALDPKLKALIPAGRRNSYKEITVAVQEGLGTKDKSSDTKLAVIGGQVAQKPPTTSTHKSNKHMRSVKIAPSPRSIIAKKHTSVHRKTRKKPKAKLNTQVSIHKSSAHIAD